MPEPRISPIPLATYRLQFRDGMTFDRAIGLIPHWNDLGISHLYASPIFRAVTGSTHGYDVTDPNVIDPALGGRDGFLRLSAALHSAGLGLILDIVPNHMAASLENPHWHSVLKWGRRSPSAPMFDNHWDQKLSLPILSGSLEEELSAGNARLCWNREKTELVLDHHGSHYPIDPATYPVAVSPAHRTDELVRLARDAATGDMSALVAHLHANNRDDYLVSSLPDLITLLERQPWQMIHWRDAANGLSYRRFFEITGLVGVRVEDPAVFDATHALILDLVAEGHVQGLRVDHIDGLADPAGYLDRLRNAIGPDAYLVVEKILEGDEQLPAGWPIQGTTGYEFIADMAGIFTAPAPELDRGWQAANPEFGEPEAELLRAKRLMIEVNFAGEIGALIRRAREIAEREAPPGLENDSLPEAVRSLVAGFDVYRTYGTAAGLLTQDSEVLEHTFDHLNTAAPALRPAFEFLENVLLGQVDDPSREDASLFRTRLQHVTGPILAKSLEDTFFYRYNRLIALNEVGGDPIGAIGGVDGFHRRMTIRRATQPHALNATSTHDTKRGEDARARLYAISEAPARWIDSVGEWRRAMSAHGAELPDGPAPEPAVEWLLFQSLAGMLPPEFDPAREDDRKAIEARLIPYVEKTLREAKLRSNWSEVNEPYEHAVKAYASAMLASEPLMTRFWSDIGPFVRTGLINSLSQTLLKLTAPGIPDIYQGTEGADTSLVDPDNRRLPDYGHMSAATNAPSLQDFAATKSWLIRTVLAARRNLQDVFAQGDYIPLETRGPRSGNLVAFARTLEDRAVVVIVPRLVLEAVEGGTLRSDDYWADTAVILPQTFHGFRDCLATAKTLPAGPEIRIADLFAEYPLALLVPED
ncbi:MAG: malto-oligosyltrehalose synthase [Rhizobium sp.]|nr:malto-oligosyltrehalose synthase [Rhizobium sp.]